MESISAFIQHLLSGRRALGLIAALYLLAPVAQAEDAIRQAVKLRIEKTQEVDTDVEIELKKGEEASPIAPQSLDGFDGQVIEPFVPAGAEEKKKIFANQGAKKRKAKTAKAKKKAVAKHRTVHAAKKRRVKKGRRLVRRVKGKEKRRPASKGRPAKRVKKKVRSPKGKKAIQKKATGRKARGRKPVKKE